MQGVRNRLCNDLNDAEAQICCYGMEAIVLGVVTETRASNETKEDAAEGVDVFRIPQTAFSCPLSTFYFVTCFLFRGLGGPAGRFFDSKEVPRVLIFDDMVNLLSIRMVLNTPLAKKFISTLRKKLSKRCHCLQRNQKLVNVCFKSDSAGPTPEESGALGTSCVVGKVGFSPQF